MKPADLYRKLAALKLDPEQMAGVLEIMDEEAEGRKEKARARWHKWNDKKDGANVSKRLLADSNVSSQLTRGDTRVEDNLLPKKITGQEERKKEAPQATPRRATRLRHDWTLPMDWYREAEAAGLSHDQIGSEAKAMLNWSLSDRNGAKLDWQATWRNWFARAARSRPTARAGPPKPMSLGEMFREDARQNGILNDQPPANPPGRMENRNGDGEVAGAGDPRVIALTRNVLGGFR